MTGPLGKLYIRAVVLLFFLLSCRVVYCGGARCNPLFAFGQGRFSGVTCEVKGSSARFARPRATSVRARSPSAPVPRASLSQTSTQVVPRPAL